MRIKIKTSGKSFFIPFPLGLAKLGISIAGMPFVTKRISEKNRKYIDIINFNELAKCINDLKKYKGLRIVEVKAKDGTEVVITI